MDRIGIGEHLSDEGMPDFVESGDLLLLLGHLEGFLRGPHEDLLDRLLDHLLGDVLLLVLPCEDGGFVEEVREIRSRESDGGAGDLPQIDLLLDRLVLGMHFKDLHAVFKVREVDGDFPVESSRPEQCLIEDIRAVRRRHDDDIGVIVEAVHFGKDLVEGLFPFVVSSADSWGPLLSDGIDLIDEDDRWRLLFRFLEEIPHSSGADPYEHLHEFGSGDREEGDSALSCHSSCQERLSGPGRADHEDSSGDLRSEIPVFLGILEEVDDLDQFLFFFIGSGNVRERDLIVVSGIVEPRPRFDECHRAVGTS